MVTWEGVAGPGPGQSAVYRKYLRLQLIAKKNFSSSIAGRLVLSLGFEKEGMELALATTIAGGTFLGIEPESDALKSAVRNASCDFMVNTLDEALRVLKNEIRKRAPLSTGLLGSPANLLPEIAERGVQPDLIANLTPERFALRDPSRAAWDQILERGVQQFPADFHESAELLAREEVRWTATSPQDMRRMDTIALQAIPATDTIRRQWLEHAARYFRHAPLERVVHLSGEERAKIFEALRRESQSSPLQGAAILHWRDANGVQQSSSI